ncbi:kinase-like domain-containing protein [Trametes polyzona]|nr:kinase-like domain-containing protein [Trametes polyzona]
MAGPSSFSFNLPIAGGKYRLDKQIGSGAYGKIYLGTNVITGERVAIKLESVHSKHPQLEYEAEVYKILSPAPAKMSVPTLHYFGTGYNYHALVIDLLGPSLDYLFQRCDRKFSLKTVLMLADQLLHHVEYIHSCGIVHRDLKPANLLMGVGDRRNQVYAIDFGLSKKWRDPRTHQHIPYQEDRPFMGTARYASIFALLGAEQVRRDDLEALAYVLIYFLRGALPWQSLRARTTRERRARIRDKKMTVPAEALCAGLPAEFAIFLNYARALRFDDAPDYAFVRALFRALAAREGVVYDDRYDWCPGMPHALDGSAPRPQPVPAPVPANVPEPQPASDSDEEAHSTDMSAEEEAHPSGDHGLGEGWLTRLGLSFSLPSLTNWFGQSGLLTHSL